MSKRNIGFLNNNWKGGHRLDPIKSEPLTKSEQDDLFIKHYHHMRHVELSWAKHFREQNKPDIARKCVLNALDYRKKLHTLLAEVNHDNPQ